MDKEKFGKFLLELRKEKNLTQQDFADLFNVSFQAVSKWENGDSIPDITILEQISDFYKISINDLLKGQRETNIKTEEKKEESSDFSINIAKTRIIKLLFASFFLVIYLLFCLISMFKAYNNGLIFYLNYYDLIFSKSYKIGNVIYLFSFIFLILSSLIGIISVFKNNNKFLIGIEELFIILGVVFYVSYSFSLINNGLFGLYLMIILLLVYLFLFLYYKELNFKFYFSNKYQKLIDLLPFYLIIPFFFSHGYSYYLYISLGIYLISILLFVLNFKYNNMKLFIFRHITMYISCILIMIFISNNGAEYLGLIILIILYVIIDFVLYKRGKVNNNLENNNLI